LKPKRKNDLSPTFFRKYALYTYKIKDDKDQTKNNEQKLNQGKGLDR
jgi:hypothetical protein